jgi:hypothetical protein
MGGGLALQTDGGQAFMSHKPRFLRIFLMTSSSSMKLKIFIFPENLGQQRESVSYIMESDHTRDGLPVKSMAV